MQKSKKLPNITFKHTNTDFQPPIRRRNLSLSSNYQNTQRNNVEKDIKASIKFKTLAKCYSKKNKLFLKSQKIKKARDLTKLCQQNILEYISLKNDVKKMQLFDEEQRSSEKTNMETHETSPKLSVKLLNMPINLSFKSKYQFLPTENSHIKIRVKTQPSPKKTFKMQNIRQVDPKLGTSRHIVFSPKKYNELTLRQIIESSDEISDKLQLYQKIKQFKSKIRQNIKYDRIENEDQPLQGW